MNFTVRTLRFTRQLSEIALHANGELSEYGGHLVCGACGMHLKREPSGESGLLRDAESPADHAAAVHGWSGKPPLPIAPTNRED